VLVAGVCLLAPLLAAMRRLGAKSRPLDPEVIRRLRRISSQTMRDERFPNE
jgi:hypothetical protein